MLWFLATPYRFYQYGRMRAYEEAITQAALLVGNGVQVYSPIVHCAPIEFTNRIPTSFNWYEYNVLFMQHCDGLIVCRMVGWQQCPDVVRATTYFANKPMVPMMPNQLPDLSMYRGSRWEAGA